MDLRMKVYQELVNSAVTIYTDDRIFQVNSTFTPPNKKPFLVIRMGLDQVDKYPIGSHTQNFQLWAHDEPGDYHQVDQILAEARAALLSAARETGFFEFRYLETGPDTEDDQLGTIVKFARYQAVLVDALPIPQP
jgi:hypothetical protein